MNAAISRLSLFSDTMLSAVLNATNGLMKNAVTRTAVCGSRPDTPAESLIYECPPIGKDYYIKKYEKRKRQYFKGMGDRGPAGWNRRPSHPLPVKKEPVKVKPSFHILL